MTKSLCEIWLDVLRGVSFDELVDQPSGIEFASSPSGITLVESTPSIPQKGDDIGAG
jgi:hypothetical protein